MSITLLVNHNKTGKTYLVLGDAIDTTNGQNDKKMIIYNNMEGGYFVREESEFWEKFTPIPDEIPPVGEEN
jgi:hypothetical protein